MTGILLITRKPRSRTHCLRSAAGLVVGICLVFLGGCHTYWRGDHACPSIAHAASQRTTATRHAHAAMLKSSAISAGYTETQWTSLEPTVSWSEVEMLSDLQRSISSQPVDEAESLDSTIPVRDALPWVAEMMPPDTSTESVRDVLWEESTQLEQAMYEPISTNLAIEAPTSSADEQEVTQAAHMTLRRQLLELGYQKSGVSGDQLISQEIAPTNQSALEYIDVEILK